MREQWNYNMKTLNEIIYIILSVNIRNKFNIKYQRGCIHVPRTSRISTYTESGKMFNRHTDDHKTGGNLSTYKI